MGLNCQDYVSSSNTVLNQLIHAVVLVTGICSLAVRLLHSIGFFFSMIMGSDCQGSLSGTPGSCFVTSKRNCLKMKQTHKGEPAERMIERQSQVLE